MNRIQDRISNLARESLQLLCLFKVFLDRAQFLLQMLDLGVVVIQDLVMVSGVQIIQDCS